MKKYEDTTSEMSILDGRNAKDSTQPFALLP
jgi:hypothetical protein